MDQAVPSTSTTAPLVQGPKRRSACGAAGFTVTNETRSRIMLLAWDLFRDGGRTFADALRGAWKLTKGIAQAASRLMARARRSAGRLQLSPSLIRSPMQRATSTQRFAGRADWHAARVTARLGV